MHQFKSGVNNLVLRAVARVQSGELAREEGQGTVEYVMVGGVIVVLVVAAATGVLTDLVEGIVGDAETAISTGITNP